MVGVMQRKTSISPAVIEKILCDAGVAENFFDHRRRYAFLARITPTIPSSLD